MKYIGFFSLLCISIATPAMTQPRFGHHPGEEHYRGSGNANAYLGAGSSNGVRLGLRYYFAERISAEASLGYVRLKQLDVPEQTVVADPADGYSASVGVNYVTHPLNDISPMLTLLLSYNKSLNSDPDKERSRIIITTAVGADYSMFWRIVFFFRAGPSIHFLSKSDRNAVQMFVHFDGGVGISF